ncbi:unnamed protein product [Calypogeia fissa]
MICEGWCGGIGWREGRRERVEREPRVSAGRNSDVSFRGKRPLQNGGALLRGRQRRGLAARERWAGKEARAQKLLFLLAPASALPIESTSNASHSRISLTGASTSHPTAEMGTWEAQHGRILQAAGGVRGTIISKVGRNGGTVGRGKVAGQGLPFPCVPAPGRLPTRQTGQQRVLRCCRLLRLPLENSSIFSFLLPDSSIFSFPAARLVHMFPRFPLHVIGVARSRIFPPCPAWPCPSLCPSSTTAHLCL